MLKKKKNYIPGKWYEKVQQNFFRQGKKCSVLTTLENQAVGTILDLIIHNKVHTWITEELTAVRLGVYHI